MMKRIQYLIPAFMCLMLFTSTLVMGQNVSPLNFSGDHNGWAEGATSFTASHHRVTFQASGTLTSKFKFRNSGWDNTWSRGALIALKTKDIAYAGGGDSEISITENKYYSISLSDVTIGNNGSVMVQETSGDPVTLDAVSQSPLAGNVTAGEDVTISITTSASPSAEEIVYVRYTADSWTTSQVVKATFVGTTGTAVIPNQGTNQVDYYVFSTTIDDISADYDLAALKLNTNGGSNYSYTGAAWTTDNDGDWSTAATWTNNAVPSTTANLGDITISHDVTLDQDAIVSALTINSSNTFTASDATPRTLTITNSASGSQATFTNNGTWANGTGGSTVVFTGAPSSGDTQHKIAGSSSTAFQNVTVNKTGGTSNVGSDFQTGTSVTGTLRIGNGGYVATAPPSSFYGSSAILDFNQGGAANYEVNNGDNSWSTTEVPNNITITTGTVTLNEARTLTGELLIESGATLVTNGNFNLASGGILSNNGTITGDINFLREITGDAGWRMLSLPITGGTVADISDDTAIQGVAGGDNTEHDSNFYFNPKAGSGESNGWTVPTNTTTAWGDGLGFITYFYDNTDAGSSELPITLDATGDEPSGDVAVSIDSIYTLLGNPYARNISIDEISGNGVAVGTETILQGGLKSPISVWNNSKGTWSTFNFGSGDVISAWQGFFVERDQNALTVAVKASEVTIPESAKTTDVADSTVFAKLGAPTSRKIDFSLSGEGFNDLSNKLYFTSLSNEGKDPFDGTKLAGLNNAPYIAFIQNFGNGSEYLVQDARALSIEEKQVYQLGINDMGVSGEFTLSWPNWENIPEDWDFVLSDHNTGYSIDMRDESSYSFTSESRQKRPVTTSLLPPSIKAKSSGIAPRFTITLTASNMESSNEIKELPNVFALDQNYPNPFNPTTTIKYSVAKAGEVHLSVYNMMGQKVTDLVSGTKQAGNHAISWNAEGMASGMYFYRLSAAGQTITRQMTLIK